MEKLYIIKIGGNIVDNTSLLTECLTAFSKLEGQAILVHGGGKLATQLASSMGVEQTMVEGRRITDEATLKIVTMVYAGAINKNIVAQLQSFGVNAMGLTGADGNLIQAHKRTGASIDYGFVGDVDGVNTNLVKQLLFNAIKLVVAPITHDGNGQLLNTNADTIAQELAKAMSQEYRVELIYSFEKNGVLLDVNDEHSVIPMIDPLKYAELKSKELIFAGMIPKLDNAFAALQSGVNKVIIGRAEDLLSLVTGEKGTMIIHE